MADLPTGGLFSRFDPRCSVLYINTVTRRLPWALNNLGVVLGDTGGPSAVLWQAGTVMPLPLPEGSFCAGGSRLNDHNDVAGTGFSEGGATAPTGAIAWHEGEATILIPPDPVLNFSSAGDINSRGVIVGMSLNLDGLGVQAATIWDGRCGQDLNTLISRQDPLQPFVRFRDALLINNRGQIVAEGFDSRRTDDRTSWYLLTPVAEQ